MDGWCDVRVYFVPAFLTLDTQRGYTVPPSTLDRIQRNLFVMSAIVLSVSGHGNKRKTWSQEPHICSEVDRQVA